MLFHTYTDKKCLKEERINVAVWVKKQQSDAPSWSLVEVEPERDVASAAKLSLACADAGLLAMQLFAYGA